MNLRRLIVITVWCACTASCLAESAGGYVLEPLPNGWREVLPMGLRTTRGVVRAGGGGGGSATRVSPGWMRLYSWEGELIEENEVPGRTLTDRERRFVAAVTHEEIRPVSKEGVIGDPFPSIRGRVYPRRRADGSLIFIRGNPPVLINGSPKACGRSVWRGTAGFAVYDEQGGVLIERGEDSGLHLALLLPPLEDALLVTKDEWGEPPLILLDFDGVERARIAPPPGEKWSTQIKWVNSNRFFAVSYTSPELRRRIDVYRRDGERVLRLDSPHRRMDVYLHGDALLKFDRSDRRRLGVQVYDLVSGRPIGQEMEIDLNGSVGPSSVNRFADGNWFLSIRLSDHDIGPNVYKAVVIDHDRGEVAWRSEPQAYDYDDPSWRVIHSSLGRASALHEDGFIGYMEGHGPAVVRPAD